MNFTDRIAVYIKEEGLDLRHLTIVLPSERAKKYIAASLYNTYNQPLIAPKMITIDRLVRECCPKVIIDKTRALIQLFEVQLASATTPEDRSFDEFMNWGNILLSDYDEIDRYLLDAKHVFKNLADIKEIENWSFGQETLTESQKRFMEFWDRLPGYYNALNKRLEEANQCYMGKAYRELAENIDRLFTDDKNHHYIFAGFNALSKAEMSIMKQVERMGRGHLLINADVYYLQAKNHEAGRFIKRLQSYLDNKKLSFVEDELGKKPMNVEVIECAQTTGQVKVASTRLQELDKQEIDETLILLADESLIAPLLRNLPKKVEKANITLGLPLRATSLKTWVELIFNIQENKQRFNTQALYYKDVQRLLKHPFILACANAEDTRAIVQLEQNILEKNRIFLTGDKLDLTEIITELIHVLIQSWEENWTNAMACIRQLNRKLYASFGAEHQLEKAAIEAFDKSITLFEEVIHEGIPDMNLRTFKNLFNQHWSNRSIAYHGNPMSGLQIMGLLETRLLDFKRIICLGLNEGTMPPTNPIQTMIPMDLRKYLELPTTRDKQGLFAHHFYRLLHKCEDLLVTYTSAAEKIGSNEQSRYLLQLELELKEDNPNIQWTKKFYHVPMKNAIPEDAIAIRKSKEVKERMDAMFARSTSASMIKTYFTCPLDFYYKFVLEFGEEDTVEEDIETSTFGTFIHDTLEELFKGFVDQKINLTVRDIDEMIGQYERMITAKFHKHFSGDKQAYTTGRNLLYYQMALQLTLNFLKEQKEFIKRSDKLFIKSVEELLEHDLEVEVFGEKKMVHLKGYVDRIDMVGDKLRIIDYKSGKTTEEEVSITDTRTGDEELFTALKKKHAFQLLMYCYLYNIKYGRIPDEVGIISFVNVKDGLLSLTPKKRSIAEWVELFPTVIQQLLEEMYDEEIPFEHQDKGMFSYCKYCD